MMAIVRGILCRLWALCAAVVHSWSYLIVLRSFRMTFPSGGAGWAVRTQCEQ